MKKLLVILLLIVGCSTCPLPKWTPDCGIIMQKNTGVSVLFKCNTGECREAIWLIGNEKCTDGLYIVERWECEDFDE